MRKTLDKYEKPEENKKMARHSRTMATISFTDVKLLLFLIIIFKHFNPSLIAIHHVIAVRIKNF